MLTLSQSAGPQHNGLWALQTVFEQKGSTRSRETELAGLENNSIFLH